MAKGGGLVRAIGGFFDPEWTRPSIRFVAPAAAAEGAAPSRAGQ